MLQLNDHIHVHDTRNTSHADTQILSVRVHVCRRVRLNRAATNLAQWAHIIRKRLMTPYPEYEVISSEKQLIRSRPN